jgi:hypothetical protein
MVLSVYVHSIWGGVSLPDPDPEVDLPQPDEEEDAEAVNIQCFCLKHCFLQGFVCCTYAVLMLYHAVLFEFLCCTYAVPSFLKNVSSFSGVQHRYSIEIRKVQHKYSIEQHRYSISTA